MDSISTKRGDAGETSLLYGGRVSKSHIAMNALGTGDEAIAALGLAYSASGNEFVRELVRRLQEKLFALNARLATKVDKLDKLAQNFTVDDALNIAELDEMLADLEGKVKLPPNFIIPGASVASAGLDLARTIVRRLERIVVAMYEQKILGDHALNTYLNRMSDILFLLARYQDSDRNQPKLTGLKRTKNL